MRLTLGTALVVAGALLGVQEVGELDEVTSWMLSHAGVALIAGGLVVALLIGLPQGSRTGPWLLILIGVIVFLAQQGLLSDPHTTWRLIGVALVASGVWLLYRLPLNESMSLDPVRTVRTILLPKRMSLGSGGAPDHLNVVCVAGLLRVDASAMTAGAGNIVEVSVRLWAGRLELVLPATVVVLPGRLAATSGIRFGGAFDDNRGPVNLLGRGAQVSVTKRTRAVATARGQPEDVRVIAVVVNVSGVAGVVALTRA